MNVKCNKCGRSWDAINTNEKCPFCGSVPEKKEVDFSDFTEVLKYVVAEFGVEIYKTPNKLVSVVNDLAPAFDRERRRLKMCGESGVLDEFIAISANETSAQKIAAAKAVSRLTDYYELQGDKAEEVVYAVAKSLSWKIDKPQKGVVLEDSVPSSSTTYEKKIDKTTALATQKTAQTENYTHGENAQQQLKSIVGNTQTKSEQKPATYSVGDIIQFGKYPQGIKGKVKPIEWQILDVKQKKAFLISKYALDYQPYDNTKRIGVTWETCSLRKWMNSSFLNTAFDSHEQNRIINSTVKTFKTHEYSYGQPPRFITVVDKMFLLDSSEIRKLFFVWEESQCTPTAYAISQGAPTYNGDNYRIRSRTWYWLREPGRNTNLRARTVNPDGRVNEDGIMVDGGCSVRPAMWCEINGLVNLSVMQKKWKSDNLCQHCGGSFKGLIRKTCANCGEPKDY